MPFWGICANVCLPPLILQGIYHYLTYALIFFPGDFRNWMSRKEMICTVSEGPEASADHNPNPKRVLFRGKKIHRQPTKFGFGLAFGVSLKPPNHGEASLGTPIGLIF